MMMLCHSRGASKRLPNLQQTAQVQHRSSLLCRPTLWAPRQESLAATGRKAGRGQQGHKPWAAAPESLSQHPRTGSRCRSRSFSVALPELFPEGAAGCTRAEAGWRPQPPRTRPSAQPFPVCTLPRGSHPSSSPALAARTSWALPQLAACCRSRSILHRAKDRNTCTVLCLPLDTSDLLQLALPWQGAWTPSPPEVPAKPSTLRSAGHTEQLTSLCPVWPRAGKSQDVGTNAQNLAFPAFPR